jgi:glycyl-tRNA synthetase beta chain
MSKSENFIIEIGTEELPPKDLQLLSNAFAEGITQELTAAGVFFTEVKTFASPRRLTVMINQLSDQTPETTETRLGPAKAAAFNADGSPTKAGLGFASSCGIDIKDLSTTINNNRECLSFERAIPAQKTTSLLASIVEKSLAKLPIKRNMHWGTGEFSFVRPVHWVLMLYGKDIVDATIFGIKSSNTSLGHRIHCPKPIKIFSADSYEQQLLEEGKVIADFAKRKQKILAAINKLASKINGTPVVDADLLDLVCGLVEHPVGLIADFNQEFLRVPKECLISAMQDHQKSFALVNKDGELLPKFILISNLESTDPATVIRGNELVMHARLADAAFYFDKDKKQRLEDRVEQLKTVIYQKKLGSIYDKTLRIQHLASQIAQFMHVDLEKTKRAALLCKADLLTSMVYEFPELQGIMGCYYAKNDKENEAVAIAIQDHYKPRFAQDELPSSDIGTCLALADRIDTLVGLFGIGSIPTGEKDPYALRRQALAVLRILIEKNINLDLADLFAKALENYQGKIANATAELLNFCFDRLKAWYLADHVPAKTFAAVLAGNSTKPLDFDRRLKAVTAFQTLDAAVNLAAANKRVQNLLEKNPAAKSNNTPDINVALLEDASEKELYSALQNKETELKPLLQKADYTAILKSLASLQAPVDNFFTNVMVMTEDEKIRNNRLNLLQRLRNLFLQVADVSLL